MKENKMSRRNFMQTIGNAGLAIGLSGMAGRVVAAGVKPKQSKVEVPRDANGNIIPGFDKTGKVAAGSKPWKPYSDRKVRVGIAGFGLCQFGAQFSFQTSPNVEVVAVTDLDPGRCA
ncbi:MAG: gfo/Idh/MocA family oxidoreductase, partial [Chlamydiae bacterium]